MISNSGHLQPSELPEECEYCGKSFQGTEDVGYFSEGFCDAECFLRENIGRLFDGDLDRPSEGFSKGELEGIQRDIWMAVSSLVKQGGED